MTAAKRFGNAFLALMMAAYVGCREESTAKLPRVHEWAAAPTERLMSRDYKTAVQLLLQVPRAMRDGPWWQLLEASAVDCYTRDKDQWCADRFREAIQDCELIDPENSSCLFWTGVGLDELGNHSEAQRNLDRAERAARRELQASTDHETVSAAKMVLQNLESRKAGAQPARTP
jgi:hypothetical protein